MKIPFQTTIRTSIVGAALLSLGLTCSVSAKDKPLSDNWKFEAQTYLWGAGMSGDLANGSSYDYSFNDVLDDLDLAIMGSLAARKGDFIIVGDAVYMDLKSDEHGQFKLGPDTISTDFNVEMTSWVVNLIGGYTIVREGSLVIDLAAGARYLNIDVDLKAKEDINTDIRRRAATVDQERGQHISQNEDIWNGVIGLRGQYDLTEKLTVNAYGDVGTGDTNLTWQAQAGITYKMGDWGLLAGYRIITWDFDDSDKMGKLLNDLEISSPYLGARYTF